MKRSTKTKVKWSTALISALLLIAAAALAAQTLGYVNWNGEFTPAATVTVDLQPGDDAEIMRKIEAIEALLTDIPDGEFWSVRDETAGTGRYGFIGPHLTSMEELAAYLDGFGLLLPAVPRGYTVQSVELSYDRENLLSLDTPYDTREHNGLTLYKYRLNAVTPDTIMGYTVSLADGSGNRLAVDAYLLPRAAYEEPEDGAFFVDEGQAAETLTVAGFKRALMIIREDGSREIRLQQDVDGDRIANYHVYMQADVDILSVFAK